MPVVAEPPAWIAPYVTYAVEATAGADGAAELVRLAPAPKKVVARADVKAGDPVELATIPTRTGRFRYVLRLPGEDDRPLALRVRPLVVMAVGDVSPGSAIDAVQAHGPAWHWARVGATLRSADIAIGNLETAIGRGGSAWPDKQFHFIAPLATVQAAHDVGGLDALSLANNHALDYGRATFARSLAPMRRLGVALFGGGENAAAASTPAVLEAGGLSVSIVGVNDVEPFGFWATPRLPGNQASTDAGVVRATRNAAAAGEIRIVYFHWGAELATTPAPRQVALARVALRNGATVVLGAHPHVWQPVQRVRGRRLIAWSLGNFVFAPGSLVATRSAILELSLDGRGVRSYRLRPVRLVGTRPVPGRGLGVRVAGKAAREG